MIPVTALILLKTGGVCYHLGRTLHIKNCYFVSNSGFKGIISIISNDLPDQNIIVENTIFKTNFGGYGGVVGIFISLQAKIRFEQNYFIENFASSCFYIYIFLNTFF